MKRFIRSIICLCILSTSCFSQENDSPKTGQAAVESASSFTTIAWASVSIAILITTGIIVAIKISDQ